MLFHYKKIFQLFLHCKTLTNVALKMKQREKILIFKIEKLRKLNNFIHHHMEDNQLIFNFCIK